MARGRGEGWRGGGSTGAVLVLGSMDRNEQKQIVRSDPEFCATKLLLFYKYIIIMVQMIFQYIPDTVRSDGVTVRKGKGVKEFCYC